MSTHSTCPDSDALVSFLYDEFEPGIGPGREEVARHVAACDRCAGEIAALGGVREQLAAWTTPEVDLGFRVVQEPRRRVGGLGGWLAGSGAGSSWWSPAWRALPIGAAPPLVMGGALGLARLDIQYDANGLRVRTGWGHDAGAVGASAPSAASVARRASGAAVTPASAPLTTADLETFGVRLRRELATSVAPTSVPNAAEQASSSRTSDAAVLKLVRQLIDESEVRQQQNLQLRFTELSRDFQMQRKADLVQIEQGFGRLAGDSAQQRQMLKQYLRNVSTAPRPQ